MVRSRNPLLFFVALIAVVAGIVWQRVDHSQPAAVSHPRVAAETPAAAIPATIPELVTAGERNSVSLVDKAVRGESEKEQLLATLALIESGGPFPYEKDGTVFGNREGRLPKKPRGYYREYTVPTPGASNRGARRIVRGREGETYYTRDHYGSFVRIDE